MALNLRYYAQSMSTSEAFQQWLDSNPCMIILLAQYPFLRSMLLIFVEEIKSTSSSSTLMSR